MPLPSSLPFERLSLNRHIYTFSPYQVAKTDFIALEASCVLVTAVATTMTLSSLQGQLSKDHCGKRSRSERPTTVELRPLSIQSSASRRVRVPSSAHLSSSSSDSVRVQRGYASSGSVRLPSSYAPSSSSGGVRLPSTWYSSSSSSVYVRDPVY